MKREYSTPAMKVEVFEASESVAACWKINCNVPTGYGYRDNNGNGKFDDGDERLTNKTVRGCGIWHKGVKGVPDDGPAANAMWHAYGGVFTPSEDYPVYWWSTGEGSNNQHFSKVSDAQWETNPNAS